MLGYKHLGSRLSTWIWRNFTVTAAHHGDREYQVWNQNTNSFVPWWSISTPPYIVQHCTVCSIFSCSRVTVISISLRKQNRALSFTNSVTQLCGKSMAATGWWTSCPTPLVRIERLEVSVLAPPLQFSWLACICVRSKSTRLYCTQGTSVNVLPVNLFTTSSKLP